MLHEIVNLSTEYHARQFLFCILTENDNNGDEAEEEYEDDLSNYDSDDEAICDEGLLT